MLFGPWLKTRRKALDLRQEDLAERVGCSPKTIEKIEAGERRPSKQVAELLAEHLQVPPDERDAFVRFARAERASTQVGEASEQARDTAPWRTLHHYTTNLPAGLTELIGREADLDTLSDLLRRERVRLVTLTGAPGIGKTSLALAVADAMLAHFEDGVFLVLLAPVTDPELVVSTTAQTLGLHEGSEQEPLTQVTEYLKDRRLLLVLDNFEQVLDAGPVVSELLASCPWLKIVVTSRAALHLRGERQFEVPPLSTEPQRVSEQGDAQESPAVVLFAERARHVSPDFSVTPSNAGVVAAICSRLGGMPLAIELAAARVHALTPEALLARLESGLSMLSGGPRDLPPRHRTLRAAIDWSYNLLTPGEQTLFSRMSVFVGGCTLPAIEAVCNPRGDLGLETLEAVSSLLDKSLLRQAASEGVTRERVVTLLEPIREYALERLEERGDAEVVRGLHAEYYMVLAEAGDAELRGPGQEAWLGRFESEHDNFRAALRWAIESGEVQTTLRLAGALGWFWELRGHSLEGLRWLGAILERPGIQNGRHPGAYARALNAAGRLSYATGDLDRARDILKQALDTARAAGDKYAMTLALHNLGNVADAQGEYDTERHYHAEGLALSRELGDRWGMAWALMGLGHVAINQGDLPAARQHFEETLSLRRQMRDRWGIARSLNELGDVARVQRDYEAARIFYGESLQIHESLGHKSFLAVCLHNLGHTARHQGNPEEAARLFSRAMSLFALAGEKPGVGLCIASLGVIAYEQGQLERAARHFGAAEALIQTSRYHMDRMDRAELSAPMEEARARPELTAAWTQGSGMLLEEAMAYASEVADATEEAARNS